MKKNFSFFLLTVTFIGSSFSYANTKVNSAEDDLIYCADYAYRMAAREADAYGGFDGHDEWVESFDFYYEACFESGEDIADAVFL